MTNLACHASTPLGVFTALYQDGEIVRVLFPDETPGAKFAEHDDSLPFAVQMREYFSGERRVFDLPIRLSGTPFMQEVYRAVSRIPFGRTATYSQVALCAGYPQAMRAVGSALRRIPLPILIPCHRVVHKAAGKSAYRGGTHIKNYLLEMEQAYLKESH